PLPTVQPTPSGNTFSPTGGEAVRRVNPDNLDRLRLLDVLPAGGSPIINGAMSEDGRYFVSANAQGEVLLWDLETRTQLARLEGHAPGDFFVAEFAPEGDRLVTQDAIFTRRLWALPSAELLAEYDEEFGAIAMAFSPEGRYLATGGYSNSVYVWDAATGEEVTRLEGHSNYVFHVAFSKNGRWLASVGPDSPLHVWDVAAWMLDQTIDLDNGARLWAADFTWDDDMLAVSSGNLEQPGRLHFVDRASGQELFTRDVHTSTVFDVVWTPSYLFSVDFDSVLNLWTAQGDLVHSQEGIACGVMPLSETLFVVSTQQGGSVFYDLPDGSPNPVQPFSDLAPNSCVYINLVGNLYITTSADGLVRLWGIPE
ncbi:MAG: WD40 repeat domain-containing protein, partial [Anaerolineales bacterium]